MEDIWEGGEEVGGGAGREKEERARVVDGLFRGAAVLRKQRCSELASPLLCTTGAFNSKQLQSAFALPLSAHSKAEHPRVIEHSAMQDSTLEDLAVRMVVRSEVALPCASWQCPWPSTW